MIGVILLKDQHSDALGIDAHEIAIDGIEHIQDGDVVYFSGNKYTLNRCSPRLTKQGAAGNFHGKFLAQPIFQAEEWTTKADG